MKRLESLLLVLVLVVSHAYGQTARLACDTLALSDTLVLSHGFVVPNSLYLYLYPSSERLYPPPESVQLTAGKIILPEIKTTDSLVLACYRYFDPAPALKLRFRDFQTVIDTTKEKFADVFLEEETRNKPFWEDAGKLRTSGSLSRGVTAGNNRGLSLTSGLRLQIEGDLGDGLQIAGAITDENIPIQPDGTTQQITDFDKVFIRLSKNPYSLILGDYEVQQKNSQFANYYRNVQGLKFERRDSSTYASVSLAVAKGKFNTNSLPGKDGVAGPYQLTGRNGERFIFILAGSEKVYLNGELQQRGENFDYVMDYNTSQITFTPNHVITNITRIVVDFEYNDRYYNRSLTVVEAGGRSPDKKLIVGLSYARDADNANAPFDDGVAFGAIRDTLALLGDQNGPAVTSGIALAGASTTEGEIRYARSDTTVNGIVYERYVYRQDTSARYQVVFSFVGKGNGYYLRRGDLNGNIYAWYPPDGEGTPTGEYAPVRTWVLPRLLQVTNFRGDYNFSPKLRLYSEVSLSAEDKNRLSTIDDDDNLAYAQRTGIQAKNLALGSKFAIDAEASYQTVQQEYVNLDRVYKAEYGRIWNFDDLGQRLREQVGISRVGFRWKNVGSLSAEFGLRSAGDDQRFFRQVYSISSQYPKFLQGNYTLTDLTALNDSLGSRSRWTRHEGDVYVPLGKWRTGVVLWLENKSNRVADSLLQTSFAFYDLKPYLRRTGEKFQLEASYNYRLDRAARLGALTDKSLGQIYFLKSQYRPGSSLSMLATGSYRSLDVLDTVFRGDALQNTRTLNANLQGDYQHPKRLVTSQLLYEVASEQLAAKEIRFVQVPTGQGQYVWLDSLFNNDGIQDIEEFQLANNPLVADFVRIVVPTRNFVPTTRLSFSGSMRWDLRQVIAPGGGFFQEALRRFQSITAFRLVQSQQRQEGFSSYLIGLSDIFADTSLLEASYSFRQDFTFFQNSPVGEVKFGYQDNQTEAFLVTGSEQRGNRFANLYQRLNAGPSVSFEATTRFGEKFTLAESFASRNYNIRYVEVNPKANFQTSRKLRLSAGYEFKHRDNYDLGAINASVAIQKAVFESRLNLKERNNVFVKLELASLKQTGEADFSADFELREGLEKGFNAITQIFFTYYLLSNLELSVSYDGRASNVKPMVHSGRVQVRAFF